MGSTIIITITITISDRCSEGNTNAKAGKHIDDWQTSNEARLGSSIQLRPQAIGNAKHVTKKKG